MYVTVFTDRISCVCTV